MAKVHNNTKTKIKMRSEISHIILCNSLIYISINSVKMAEYISCQTTPIKHYRINSVAWHLFSYCCNKFTLDFTTYNHTEGWFSLNLHLWKHVPTVLSDRCCLQETALTRVKFISTLWPYPGTVFIWSAVKQAALSRLPRWAGLSGDSLSGRTSNLA